MAEWSKALDPRSRGHGFDSRCRSCVKALGKLWNPQCLRLPSRNGYLVEREKIIVNGMKPLPLYAAWLYPPPGDEAVYICTSEFQNQGRSL